MRETSRFGPASSEDYEENLIGCVSKSIGSINDVNGKEEFIGKDISNSLAQTLQKNISEEGKRSEDQNLLEPHFEVENLLDLTKTHEEETQLSKNVRNL